MFIYLLIGAVTIATFVGIFCGVAWLHQTAPFPLYKPVVYTVISGTIAWIGYVLTLMILTNVFNMFYEFIPPLYYLLCTPLVVLFMTILGLVLALPIALLINRR